MHLFQQNSTTEGTEEGMSPPAFCVSSAINLFISASLSIIYKEFYMTKELLYNHNSPLLMSPVLAHVFFLIARYQLWCALDGISKGKGGLNCNVCPNRHLGTSNRESECSYLYYIPLLSVFSHRRFYSRFYDSFAVDLNVFPVVTVGFL